MKQYFILVAADEDKARLSFPSAYDRAIYRLKNLQWGLNSRTRNRKAMKPGDEVLIYASGKRENGMTFVGRARIAARPVRVGHFERYKLDSPAQKEPTTCVEFVELNDMKIFDVPVPIKSIYRKFDWVRNPDSPRWASALMGGAMRLNEHDFKTVVSEATKRNRRKER